MSIYRIKPYELYFWAVEKRVLWIFWAPFYHTHTEKEAERYIDNLVELELDKEIKKRKIKERKKLYPPRIYP